MHDAGAVRLREGCLGSCFEACGGGSGAWFERVGQRVECCLIGWVYYDVWRLASCIEVVVENGRR